MSHALGYWWCWVEIHFIASLVVYLLEKCIIIWFVFETVNLNLNYVYDIALGYYFSLLVVIDWVVVTLLWVSVMCGIVVYYFSLCAQDCALLFPNKYPCKIQNVNFKEKKCKILFATTMSSLIFYQIISDDK